MKYLSVIVLFALLTGCATGVSREQMANADYGQKMDDSLYVAYIQQSLRKSLIDPDSLKLSCANARKGWLRGLGYQPPQFGWVVYCEVNGKNRFGGYTGAKPYVYLFRGDRVIDQYPDASRGFDYDFAP